MAKFPRQLPWAKFELVLKRLGYNLVESKSGSARTFYNAGRDPEFVTFHEPHSPKTLAAGTLRSYIRKLNLSREEFLALLEQ